MAKPRATHRSLSVTLRRSPIGTPARHRLVLHGLGLRRLHQTVTRPDTPRVRGMIHKIGYLLDVKPHEAS
ncbi:MAG: 50S ribosomal protein L30 [candidate division NC10 bacterium]